MSGLEDKTYNSEEQKQTPVVKVGSTTLEYEKDYTVSYNNNTNAGKATVTITGKGNYTGTAPAAEFTINPASIKDADVTGLEDKTYNGEEQKQAPVVKVGSATLENEKDYTVSYSNNTNAGKATVTITGKGNYTGNATPAEFTINPASIEGALVADIDDMAYTGSALKPEVTVTLEDTALVKDTDFKVDYNNNINAGTATVTITGTGNYTGELPVAEFTINPASIKDAEVTEIVDKIYNGQEQTQTPVVKVGSATLKEGTDYTLTYDNNIELSTDDNKASLTIAGKGNYTGIKTVAFRILPVGWYEENGEEYFYKEDGSKQTNGWAKKDSTWYWMDAEGKITKNHWVQSKGNWYYMTASGAMATGWQQIGGKWYYMNSSGVMTTGWQQIGGKWYYMNSSGAMTTGWQQIGGKWYYMNSSGVMTTGWQQIGGKWYYMNSSGVMTTGWQQIGGKWYYMSSSGVMTTGWQQIGGKWYYMNSSGVMTTGWQQIGGKWYYMKADGSMVIGTQTIGGKTYKFNSSGVWIQ